MLLAPHRTLTLAAAVAGATVAIGCGDNACPGPSSEHTCRVARIPGLTPGGELGFRFGEPLDLDGDGIEEVVAGARRGGATGNGEAAAWTLDGQPRGYWSVDTLDGLFGHVALAVPDLDGDGRADIVVSAPNAVLDGGPRGFVDAYTIDGRRIWRAIGALYDGFGWHVARAGDRDGDGIEDLWIGAPSNPVAGHVYLVSGRDGHVVRSIAGTREGEQFGWYVVPIGDVDGDGLPDVAIGAPTAMIAGSRRGAVQLVSSSTGLPIRELAGELPDHRFGEMIAPLDDIDGDRVPDLAVSAPAGAFEAKPGSDEVSIVSGATGARLRLLVGTEAGELYGRMLALLDDLDGDGARDLAIAAPWWNGRDGRVEIRSARTLALLAEIRGSEGGWLGWHVTRASGPAIAVSQLHLDHDTGAVEVHVLR